MRAQEPIRQALWLGMRYARLLLSTNERRVINPAAKRKKLYKGEGTALKGMLLREKPAYAGRKEMCCVC